MLFFIWISLVGLFTPCMAQYNGDDVHAGFASCFNNNSSKKSRSTLLHGVAVFSGVTTGSCLVWQGAKESDKKKSLVVFACS
jgi:hypothetical protein